ncbi:MAG: 3-hydroxyacyl-CoA dehydrogenase family protein, partial [Candidatus Paceibacterota bacterium]
MAIDRIRKVAIVGGGVMGRGIALLTSQKGVYTIVKETNVDLSSRARESIFEKIDKAGPKLLCPSPQFAKDRISVTTEFSDIQDADLVIEAVPEDPSLKEDVFREIDVWVKPDALIVSNTSSLSVSEMAKATSRPGQVMGAHFFNPPVRRNLVELIRAKPTSEHTFQVVKNLVEQTLERHTIEVKECPGFLVNRVLLPGPNEAGLLLCETTLGAKEIDNRARAFGWPLGPFELLDYIGIDIAFGVAKILHLA